MFKRIVVAYNESAEASRALAAAIHLAKALGAELMAVTIFHDLPAYAGYASAVDSSLARTMIEDRRERYEQLQAEARERASSLGVDMVTHLMEGQEVDGIIQFLISHKAELLVIGLHQHSLYISRLWSKVYEVAQDAPCSVLGIH
jgi:nucleotide-binding universal stress UspA family protein